MVRFQTGVNLLLGWDGSEDCAAARVLDVDWGLGLVGEGVRDDDVVVFGLVVVVVVATFVEGVAPAPQRETEGGRYLTGLLDSDRE